MIASGAELAQPGRSVRHRRRACATRRSSPLADARRRATTSSIVEAGLAVSRSPPISTTTACSTRPTTTATATSTRDDVEPDEDTGPLAVPRRSDRSGRSALLDHARRAGRVARGLRESALHRSRRRRLDRRRGCREVTRRARRARSLASLRSRGAARRAEPTPIRATTRSTDPVVDAGARRRGSTRSAARACATSSSAGIARARADRHAGLSRRARRRPRARRQRWSSRTRIERRRAAARSSTTCSCRTRSTRPPTLRFGPLAARRRLRPCRSAPGARAALIAHDRGAVHARRHRDTSTPAAQLAGVVTGAARRALDSCTRGSARSPRSRRRPAATTHAARAARRRRPRAGASRRTVALAGRRRGAGRLVRRPRSP